MKPLKTGLAVLSVMALTACATMPSPGYYPGGAAMRGVADSQEGFANSRLVGCEVPASHTLLPARLSVHPGDAVPLQHTFTFGPYGQQHIPLQCVDHWRIEPAEAATLSADRRTLHVSEAAVPGGVITITVTANTHPHRLMLPVLGDGEFDVLGNWRGLPGQDCFGSPAPNEIHFGQDGFALFALGLGPATWDDRRAFSFDRSTGLLRLGDQSGTAHIDEEGRLVISAMRLPSARSPAPRPVDLEGYSQELDWTTCRLAFSSTSTYR
jgi:hypothetical protein